MELVNRVAKSPLITIDMEKWINEYQIIHFDISSFLFKGLMLKEMDFRKEVRNLDVSDYEGAVVRVFCSTDAIVPTWAWMLIAQKFKEVTTVVVTGSESTLYHVLLRTHIDRLDLAEYEDKPLVVRGCSDIAIPQDVYAYLTMKLSDVAKSLMFGEACSAVPVYKKRRKV